MILGSCEVLGIVDGNTLGSCDTLGGMDGTFDGT